MREQLGAELAAAATELALSLIGRVSFCHGTICSECHMGSLGVADELNHVPSCRVGKVLEAVRRYEAGENPAEDEFLRAERHGAETVDTMYRNSILDIPAPPREEFARKEIRGR